MDFRDDSLMTSGEIRQMVSRIIVVSVRSSSVRSVTAVV